MFSSTQINELMGELLETRQEHIQIIFQFKIKRKQQEILLCLNKTKPICWTFVYDILFMTITIG